VVVNLPIGLQLGRLGLLTRYMNALWVTHNFDFVAQQVMMKHFQ
jgi:hypothetical protein